MASTQVYILYAEEDERLALDLDMHLAPIRQQALIDVWYKQKLRPGESIEQGVHSHLQQAQIIIILISPLLFTDKMQDEFDTALKFGQTGQAQLIPILGRPTDLDAIQLGHKLVLPRNRVPVVLWRERDECWLEIVQELRRLLRAPDKTPTRSDRLQVAVSGHLKTFLAVMIAVILTGTIWVFHRRNLEKANQAIRTGHEGLDLVPNPVDSSRLIGNILTGHVLGSDTKILPGIEVELVSCTTDRGLRATSDRYGRFFINHIPDECNRAPYKLLIYLPDQTTMVLSSNTNKDVEVKLGHLTKIIQTTLQAPGVYSVTLNHPLDLGIYDLDGSLLSVSSNGRNQILTTTRPPAYGAGVMPRLLLQSQIEDWLTAHQAESSDELLSFAMMVLPTSTVAKQVLGSRLLHRAKKISEELGRSQAPCGLLVKQQGLLRKAAGLLGSSNPLEDMIERNQLTQLSVCKPGEPLPPMKDSP